MLMYCVLNAIAFYVYHRDLYAKLNDLRGAHHQVRGSEK